MTQSPANGAFQLYPATDEALVAEIPDSLAFEQAVVLPLAVSTASAGLYRRDYLNLPLPSADDVKSTGQVLLVWGGASSVGATTIQLAVASGLTVFATASEANREFVQSLGADTIFDYRSPTVVEDITDALKGTNFAGVFDAISERPSFTAVSEILDRLNTSVSIACVLPCDKPTVRFSPQYGT
jgi:NADPH:quinone reductase-like Zn-dependent oxidoreductase